MKTKLKVKGMHCDACKLLVRMGLEDGGFEEKIVSIDTVKEENVGEVILSGLGEQEIEKAKEIINSVGHYEVVAND